MAKKDNVIGIAMELDIENLKAGLQETSREITTANKKFAAATSEMDDWRKSSEGLGAKLEQVSTKLKNQEKNVAGYRAEIERVSKLEGNHVQELRRLNDKLLDAEAAVGKTRKEYKKYSSQLEDIKKSEKEAEKGASQLGKSFKELNKDTQSLNDGFTIFKGTLAGLATQAISGFIGGIKNAVNESKEFRKEMGMLEATADATGASFDNAKENVKEVTAITDDQGAAIEGLNNLMVSGFDGDALDKITDELVGASIKWKDTLKFEGLADGLQETLATGSAIGPFAEMLDRAGASTDEFNAGLAQCTTDAERQNFVLNELSKLGLADVKKGYEETNKTLVDSNKAQLDYNDAMAQVGEKVEPALTSIKQGFVDILNSFLEMSANVDMEAIAEGISNAFKWFIDTVVPIIKDSIQFVIDNKDVILALITGIGAGFVAWKVTSIITGVVKAMKAFTLATKGQTLAQKALNLVMKANPIGIVITLITALVTAFVVLWKKSDSFRNFWKGLWSGIKKAAAPVIDFIKKAFSATWDAIKKVWNGVKPYFEMVWKNIKAIFSAVKKVLSGDFKGAWEAIKSIWGNVGDFFKKIIDKIKDVFGELPSKMKSIGKDIVEGLWNGINDMVGWIGGKIKGFGKNVLGGLKSFFKIKSPSRLMRDEVGKFIGEGVGVGILDSTKDVLKDINKFSKKINAEFTGKVATIQTGLSGSIIPIKNNGFNRNNGVVSNSNVNNYTQIINAPKQPSRIELYRQTKNLLALKGV